MRSARPLGQGLGSTGTTNLLFFHGTTAMSQGMKFIVSLTFWVWILELDIRDDGSVLKGKYCFHNTRKSCRSFTMSQVRFDLNLV